MGQKVWGQGLTIKVLLKFRCDPCGSGTRCISCIWLVAFCHGFKDDIKFNETVFTVPFKQPYIEMYENLRDGIILGDFTDQEVESFLGATHSAIARDCLLCKDVSKLNKIRKHVLSGVKNSEKGTKILSRLKLLLKWLIKHLVFSKNCQKIWLELSMKPL